MILEVYIIYLWVFLCIFWILEEKILENICLGNFIKVIFFNLIVEKIYFNFNSFVWVW